MRGPWAKMGPYRGDGRPKGGSSLKVSRKQRFRENNEMDKNRGIIVGTLILLLPLVSIVLRGVRMANRASRAAYKVPVENAIRDLHACLLTIETSRMDMMAALEDGEVYETLPPRLKWANDARARLQALDVSKCPSDFQKAHRDYVRELEGIYEALIRFLNDVPSVKDDPAKFEAENVKCDAQIDKQGEKADAMEIPLVKAINRYHAGSVYNQSWEEYQSKAAAYRPGTSSASVARKPRILSVSPMPSRPHNPFEASQPPSAPTSPLASRASDPASRFASRLGSGPPSAPGRRPARVFAENRVSENSVSGKQDGDSLDNDNPFDGEADEEGKTASLPGPSSKPAMSKEPALTESETGESALTASHELVEYLGMPMIGERVFTQMSPGDDSYLVGLDLTMLRSQDAQRYVIQSLTPVFRSSDGKLVKGKPFGKTTGKNFALRAKAGYAVHGINAFVPRGTIGFEIVYVKINEDGTLDEGDTYASEWLGTPIADDAILKKLGFYDNPILGLQAQVFNNLNGFAFVYRR